MLSQEIQGKDGKSSNDVVSKLRSGRRGPSMTPMSQSTSNENRGDEVAVAAAAAASLPQVIGEEDNDVERSNGHVPLLSKGVNLFSTFFVVFWRCNNATFAFLLLEFDTLFFGFLLFAEQSYWLALLYAEFALSDINLRSKRHTASKSSFHGATSMATLQMEQARVYV